MLKAIAKYIQRHGLLKAGDRVGVAVSGGADSVALLRAMLELRNALGIVLAVVHFHHGIRGSEADADEVFVASLAASHQLAFHRDSAEVPAFARENRLSLEAAARKLRYQFFARLLHENALDKICTAHTSDDQAETVLLRFLRGSGTRGLAGIHPSLKLDGGEVNRPMLEVSRGDVLAYLKSLEQAWREDSTNADTAHTRNRVRHELLPLLERDYNPSLRPLLGEVADVARDEEDFWTRLIATMASDAIEMRDGTVRIRLALPGMDSAAVRRRLLRRGADAVGVQLDFHHVEQLLELATMERAGEVELPDGWRARRVGPRAEATIVIEQDTEGEESAAYHYELSIPSEVQIVPIGVTVRITFVPYAEHGGRYNPASLLDASRLVQPLCLRNWQPGDRLHPLHRGSEEKLKRLFQERHVPAKDRALWPVLVSGDKLVWARDFPVAEEFAACKGTSQAVLIEAVKF